jgi:methyltransferase family protein
VLDIGGYDGTVARLCASRGASKVTLVDSQQWVTYGWPETTWGPGQIEYHHADFTRYEEPHDLVFCFNVFYHVKNVYGAAEQLRRLTRDCCWLWTQVLLDCEDPVFHLWRPHEPNYQDKCYWRPSIPGLLALLTDVGFTTITEFARGANERLGLRLQ